MSEADVLIVAYDGAQLLDVAGPLEVFRGAAEAVPGAYRIHVGSLGGQDVTTSSGTRLGVDVDLADLTGPVGTMVVAGGWGFPTATADQELVDHLRRLATRSRRVAAVCTGAFLLGAAGLLDGRRATTHWAYCEQLAETYPRVRVEPDAIFVIDTSLEATAPAVTGDRNDVPAGLVVATSAGVTAGMDLALGLVENDHGPAVARQVARWLVVFLQRPGGQSQFSTWSRTGSVTDPALRRLVREISADPAADLSIAAMARRMSVSERHISRMFVRQVGMTPGRYVDRVRVEAARMALEGSSDGLDTIARQCGFGTAESMRRAFLRELGVPPGAYRSRFSAAAI